MAKAVELLPTKGLTASNFTGQDFLTIADFHSTEIMYLLKQALKLKQEQKLGVAHKHLNGKVLGMIFDKASTRTRVSFEVGIIQLGGNPIYLNTKDTQLGRGETVADTAKVLSRYVDAVMIRTFAHKTIEEFAAHADIPVINGLTDLHHPTQVMADLLTILEYKGKLKGLKLCYLGDGNNNMTHSLLEGAAKVGMDIAVASPFGYEPNQMIRDQAKLVAKQNGSSVVITNSPDEAIQDADVVVTDVWASMGQEEEFETRIEAFKPYQVNSKLCEKAKDDFMFMHCLPAHRGEEVTAEILDGPHSVVFDEAENRLHAQKAIMLALMGNN
ncbi:ornithine carbamoyltransferase [Pseudalkalibacillus salsuginis]|uniref:ornithine carbamoyltransferase n=1 Tax=Pseudalkalibacillus salsuginis TaxID=2910972 RepID=UPI001F372931|nr:ornithine carbamoyltransferase [Pseudalkalibacillus salsuginis]MCF6409446.1 ornithine carbamoyltransferase [Pseudalkalibacillus salsuginis]